MAENEKSEEQEALGGGENQNHQQNGSENSEKMLKPWLKNAGKEFYLNEELGQYDSLSDALKALLARPKAKETPESYGELGKVEEAYKKAGLTSDEAKEITSAFSERMPKPKPDLKEYFKDKYGEVTEDYRKGIGSFTDDALQKEITDSGLDKDPVFVSIMARVGKETGGSVFTPPKNTEEKMDYALELVKNAMGRGK